MLTVDLEKRERHYKVSSYREPVLVCRRNCRLLRRAVSRLDLFVICLCLSFCAGSGERSFSHAPLLMNRLTDCHSISITDDTTEQGEKSENDGW